MLKLDSDHLPTFLGRGIATMGALWTMASGICVGYQLAHLDNQDPWSTIALSGAVISILVGWALFEGGRRI